MDDLKFKVLCVKGFRYSYKRLGFIEGKWYDCKKQLYKGEFRGDHHVFISSNDGSFNHSFDDYYSVPIGTFKECFKSQKEIRDEKLEKILNG